VRYRSQGQYFDGIDIFKEKTFIDASQILSKVWALVTCAITGPGLILSLARKQ